MTEEQLQRINQRETNANNQCASTGGNIGKTRQFRGIYFHSQ